MMEPVDANVVIEYLLDRIRDLELEIAVLKARTDAVVKSG